MGRLIIVSNRLPMTVNVVDGKVEVARSAGGLATGLSGPHERLGGLWLGWPGDVSGLSAEQQTALQEQLTAQRAVPLNLSREEIASYYDGFANGVLWPFFHYLLDRIPHHSKDWQTYCEVNQRFASLVCQHAQPDDLIWIQDYQLALVPSLVREQLPDARIGFFLHIPFPAAEVFRILPWREEILHGLLGADLIGFHTHGYVRQFSDSLISVLGMAPDVDRVIHRGRTVRFEAFPMGIDARHFAALAKTEPVLAELAQLRRENVDQRLLLGIDRLDYTKGIPRRLRAVELLLEREPELRGKLRFIQVAVPSRASVPEYERYTDEVNRLVGSINGRFGSASSVPIHYLYRSIEPALMVAMYQAADVMLVTPLRDGMNLVAKEFVASRVDEDGVLVLSEFAGAAAELGEAVLVNPYHVDLMATQIGQALRMPVEQRRDRMRALRHRVFEYDVDRWARTFIEELERTREFAPAPTLRLSSRRELAELNARLAAAEQLVLFLDYDGTLVPFARRPELAWPDPALRDLLTQLGRSDRIDVHVVSGRQRDLLDRWFGDLPIGLHAEHGLWSRLPGGIWTQNLEIDTSWKGRVGALLEQFAIRVPGSFIEEKTAALAWHYRSADPEFGEWQARELQTHLTHALSNVPVEILLGDKVVEVQPHGVNKGLVVRRLSASTANAVAVALGDDQTDENLFAALPETGIGIHVGPRSSRAQYHLPDVTAARQTLWQLVARRTDG